ncbi:ribonuclease T2-like protein, partial [Talaromyces proteolyticus]
DTCCSETFGGLFLSTQFWNTYTGLESEGQVLPANSWTLHGLWPDFCNGSYTQYCDLNRQYDPAPSPNTTTGTANGTRVPPYTGPSIDTFLHPFGKFDLLAWMSKYWINQGAPSKNLWAHEFSKHATCYSTFDTPCFGPDAQPHSDVVNFFETAITYFLRHPTYDWLSAAGITPSNKTAYTLDEIQWTLTQASGAVPYLGCTGPRFNETAAGKGSQDNGRTVLDEVWYYFHAHGRPQDLKYKPVDADSVGSDTSCAHSKGAVWYYKRTKGSEAAA